MTSDARIPYVDPVTATGDVAHLYEGQRKFRGRVPHSGQVWGHVPHLAKLRLIAVMSLQLEGLGGPLPVRLKELAVLKTSHVNSCGY